MLISPIAIFGFYIPEHRVFCRIVYDNHDFTFIGINATAKSPTHCHNPSRNRVWDVLLTFLPWKWCDKNTTDSIHWWNTPSFGNKPHRNEMFTFCCSCFFVYLNFFILQMYSVFWYSICPIIALFHNWRFRLILQLFNGLPKTLQLHGRQLSLKVYGVEDYGKSQMNTRIFFSPFWRCLILIVYVCINFACIWILLCVLV